MSVERQDEELELTNTWVGADVKCLGSLEVGGECSMTERAGASAICEDTYYLEYVGHHLLGRYARVGFKELADIYGHVLNIIIVPSHRPLVSWRAGVLAAAIAG